MLIKRELLENIKIFLQRKEFLAIIGPRQAGKTTFLEIIKTYLKNELKIPSQLITSITFEDRRILNQFTADPIAFVSSYLPTEKFKTFYLMIDEFQYAQNGGQKLKLIYDSIPKLKIIITGSSSLDIKMQVNKYLVGRLLTFLLFPFSFAETLKAKNIRLEKIYQGNNKNISQWLIKGRKFQVKAGKDLFSEEILSEYEKYCLWGGYPAVVLSKTTIEQSKILSEIYNNYLLRDIKGLLELATENNLYRLSQYLSSQIGNIVVYNNLSEISQLDFRQMKKHLNILEETFICHQVKPFFRNRQKELSKNPKIFFLDLGFRNYLMENMNSLDKRTDSGALVENTVFIRLKELSSIFPMKINYWRTKAGAEVDFVITHGEEIIPIEVKFSSFEKEKISRSLASFISSFEPKRVLVLTKDYWGKIKKDQTEIIFTPIYYL